MRRPHQLVVLTLLALLVVACGAPERSPQSAAVPTPTLPPPSYPLPPERPDPKPTRGQPDATPTLPPFPYPLPPEEPAPVRRPSTDPALRTVWPQLAEKGAQTGLIYVETSVDAASGRETRTFWQFNSDNGQRHALWDIPPEQEGIPTGSITAKLSADAEWIGYQIGYDIYNLYVARRDGGDSRLVAKGLSVGDARGFHRFFWAPQGAALALHRYWREGNGQVLGQDYGQEVLLYDAQLNQPPRLLVRTGNMHLLGWSDDDHILAFIKASPAAPLQLVRINSSDATQEVLLPDVLLAGPAELSPNRQYVLLSTTTTAALLIDINQRTARSLDGVEAPTQTVWSGTGESLLEVQRSATQKTFFVPLDHPAQAVPVNLEPDGGTRGRLAVSGASPDGEQVILCELQLDRGGQVLEFRTLLYDIKQDQWQTLHAGTACLDIVGWLPQ